MAGVGLGAGSEGGAQSHVGASDGRHGRRGARPTPAPMPADGLAGGSATSDPPSGPSGSPNPAPPHPLPHDLTAEDVARLVHGKQTAEYGRLRGYPGFCLDPMPWAEAAACVEDGGVAALGRMGRDPAGVATYWAWKKQA